MTGSVRERVLVVEDAEDIRVSIAEVLEAEGYDVVCAANGVQAMNWLESTREPPGVILLDLMMPEMDGYQFCAAQRSDARLAAIPVVLMSAGGDIHVKAIQLGARGYLKKPFRDIEAILDTVRRVLRSRGAS